jgi:hypothetical protein
MCGLAAARVLPKPKIFLMLVRFPLQLDASDAEPVTARLREKHLSHDCRFR